jgi:uncharacterized protein YkvS
MNVKLAPFDLDAALAGRPVIQRNGMNARVHKVDDDGVVVDLMVLEDVNGDGGEIIETEVLVTVDKQGRYRPEVGESNLDLFMVI